MSKNQFDSCSYGELTECIRARIDWIREGYRFLRDYNKKDYPHLRATVRLNIVINRREIKRLLNMRRVLKRSGLKNWDSEKLNEGA